MSPVCLLQWLPIDEYRETRTALSRYREKIDLSYFDVQNKLQARESIQSWLRIDSLYLSQIYFL